MKTKFATLFMLMLPFSSVFGGFTMGDTIVKIYGSSEIKFGLTNAPALSDVCTYYFRQFKFDATTPEGKNMLSILLAAHMANKPISVWYTASTAPGTNETNGCSDSTMSVATAIGFRD